VGKGWFVTGTDTGVGKTRLVLGLMAALQSRGKVVCGMKPVASGAKRYGKTLINEDAKAIQHQCSHVIEYSLVNPFAYAAAVAPHIAADLADRPIMLDQISLAYQKIAARADRVVVEGVGGWRVPLSGQQALPDLVKMLDLSVILVVGMRLGCLNHALLSAEAILADGIKFAGWVANRLDPDFQCQRQNLETLQRQIPATFLGEIPYMERLNNDLVTANINLEQILGPENEK